MNPFQVAAQQSDRIHRRIDVGQTRPPNAGVVFTKVGLHGLAIWKTPAQRISVASRTNHAMPLRVQMRGHAAADEAGCANDKDPHPCRELPLCDRNAPHPLFLPRQRTLVPGHLRSRHLVNYGELKVWR
jgi:hypothetical protein